MSDAATEPTEVEQKQAETASSSSTSTSTSTKPGLTKENFGKFLVRLVAIFIMLVFYYYFCSGLTLYLMKVAQANLFADQEGCRPYTDYPPTFDQNIANTNIYETWNMGQEKTKWQSFKEFFGSAEPNASKVSMKLQFPLNEQGVLDILKSKFPMASNVESQKDLMKFVDEIKISPTPEQVPLLKYVYAVTIPLLESLNNDFFPEFFTKAKKTTEWSIIFGIITTIDELVCAMNTVFNKIYGSLNKISESLVYHFFPIVAFIPFLIMAGCFQVYNLFLSVKNLGFFLKKRNPEWGSPFEADNWSKKTEGRWAAWFWIIITFCTLGWVCLYTTIQLITLLLASVLVSALNKKSINEQGELETGWSSSIKSIKMHRNSILVVFSLLLVQAIYDCFGSNSGNFSLILLLIGFLFSYGPFSTFQPTNLAAFTATVSNNQVPKKCTTEHKVQADPIEAAAGFFSSLKDSFKLDPNKLKEEEKKIEEEQKKLKPLEGDDINEGVEMTDLQSKPDFELKVK